MAGHVFIGYSRKDQAYAQRLAAHLRAGGFEVWYDHSLATGDRFAKVIKERIDTCAIFVVVMTPDADDSHWVGSEVQHALNRKKPILPLLLRGEAFMELNTIEYEDVSGGRLPGERFTRKVSDLAGPPVRPVGPRMDFAPASPPTDPTVTMSTDNWCCIGCLRRSWWYTSSGTSLSR